MLIITIETKKGIETLRDIFKKASSEALLENDTLALPWVEHTLNVRFKLVCAEGDNYYIGIDTDVTEIEHLAVEAIRLLGWIHTNEPLNRIARPVKLTHESKRKDWLRLLMYGLFRIVDPMINSASLDHAA